MACLNEPLLSAYLDGSLGPGELDIVVGHLDSCPACLREFHDVKAVRAALRTMPLLDPPAELVAAVGVGPWAGQRDGVAAGHLGDDLSAYLDGELLTVESESLTAHLASCAGCRMELQELDAARTAVRALPGLEPPDMTFRQRRLDRVGAAGPKSRPVAAYIAGAATAAAAVVVTVALLGGQAEAPAVDIDRLVIHHNARQSVEAGFSVIPAFAVETGR